MILRLYVHNFRCLENFDLRIEGKSSLLLIGRNGTGKTTVSAVLELFQKIARGSERGTNRVGELVKPGDLARGRSDVPMRFELEAKVAGQLYHYSVAFEFPPGFKEMRVFEEKLLVNGKAVFSREKAQVHLFRSESDRGEARFLIDWHLVALPIIQGQSPDDPVTAFKEWLSRMLILRPIPQQITGESDDETLRPEPNLRDFAQWFSGLLAHAPAAYSTIDDYLKEIIPDLSDIQNPRVGTKSRALTVQFANEHGKLSIPFESLSDGEKSFIISAVVLASNRAYGPLFCFWDEPDTHLALDEVGHFVMALRKAFQPGGQFIATSHHPEVISHFSDENIFHLRRNSHLEPTVIRPIESHETHGNLVGMLVRGDL